MSKLGCRCGHLIRDQTDNLPYKGHILPDLHCGDFLEWVVEQTQSYLEAVREGRAEAWLLKQGYTQTYVDLKLSDSDVLYDHIHAQFLRLKRDMYECEGCGRIHVEGRENNRFMSYAPDNGSINAILATVPR